jgi:hypothetical protein
MNRGDYIIVALLLGLCAVVALAEFAYYYIRYH